ncbi:2-polyprenyl-6-methoxyphenol hydroxylase [Micromonospora eburnea]|uniref:2-polyprenyl-6-methoxyphenol hydroxylase n=2 Tax=Micromonospora eburnea TaxID=227316 RepID=A0A1C6UH50_9ACTN|nr:2-polyprenyl-6-methoxyphenol hydroxylase [Micromonospora eburnea]
MSMIGSHAIVAGGSIGGLVAATALARRFDRVTVIDRDGLPTEQARDRRGVPHGMHAHALLISGRLALEELYPGLTEELIAGGAVPFDPGADLLFHQMGAMRVRFTSGMLGISQTRAFLELTIRRRVLRLPNVTILDRLAVSGLAGVSGRVTGVELDDGRTLDADLVVDATGRSGGRSDRWLEKLDCPAPENAVVRIDVGYASRLYTRQPGDLPDGALLALMAAVPPHHKRAAAAFAVEGNRWVITIGGWHKDHAPADPAGFLAFAEGLPSPHIAHLIKKAEPLSDIETRQFPAARRRYFERLRQLPAGYVALGDTVCSFNPIYGQGMTAATLEALALGRSLDKFGNTSAEMARHYYRAAAKVLETPWRMATGGDFAYPETSGPKPLGTGLVNRYAREAFLASHVSPKVHRVLLDMQHLLVPPSALLRPTTVVRSLLAARRSPARAAVAAQVARPAS